MKKRNRVIALLLTAVMIGTTFMSGCSAGGKDTKTTAETTEKVTEKTQETQQTESDSTETQKTTEEDSIESEKVEISMMTLWAEDNKENIATSVREMIEKFQSENPDIVVNVEAIGDQTAYYTKIKTLAASNSLPDVFVCKGSELAAFAKNGLVAPLDEILDAEWKSGYIPSSFDDISTDGSIYAVPYSMLSTHVIYYNKDILKDAGYDSFPTEWTEFTKMLSAVKEKGITPIALGNKEPWVAESCIMSCLGDRFTGSDWFRSIMDGSGSKFTDAEFVQALGAMQELGTKGYFNDDMNSLNNDQQKTLYFNGEAAMFMEGSWAVGAVDAGPDDIKAKTGVAVLPAANGGKGNPKATSGGSGSGFAVGANNFGEKKDAIAKLLKALSGEEYSKSIAAKGEPVAYMVDDYDKSGVSDLALEYSDMASDLEFTPIYDSFLDPSVVDVMNSNLQELLIGVVTPEDCAKNIQDAYDALGN